MPFLKSIIIFANEMSANFMVKYTLNGILAISNRKTDHNPTDPIAIIMNNTGGRNGIFHKLVSQQTAKLEFLDILVKNMWNFLDSKKRWLLQSIMIIFFQTFFQYF